MPLTRSLTKFTTTGPILANYDWEDLVNGFGYIQFKAWVYEDDTAEVASLIPSSQAFYPSPIYPDSLNTSFTGKSASSFNTWTAVMDKTYTTSGFSKAQNIDGTAYFNIPFHANGEAPTSKLAVKFTVTLTGSVTGAIATNTVEITGDTADDQIGRNMYVDLDVDNVQIAVGETLSVQVEVWLKKLVNDIGDDVVMIVTYDPMDGDHTYDAGGGIPAVTVKPSTDACTSTMSLNLPYKIEL